MTSRIFYQAPVPGKIHIEPLGNLAETPECACLWYFLRRAHQIAKEIPEQITLVGETDRFANLRTVANTTAELYGVTLSQVFTSENIRRAEAEIAECGLAYDWRVKAFINSGGREFATWTRDPDALEGKA